MASTVSSRLSGNDISAKQIQDSNTRSSSRRWSADSSPIQRKISSSDNNSPKGFTLKSAIKRSNSLTINNNVETTSKWRLSPGRSSSPTAVVANKPPTSPSRVKGVGNLLSIGLELLKGKKSSPSLTWPSSPLGPVMGESIHQLKILHNRLIQWRYANARAENVNGSITKQFEITLIYGWDGLTKLRRSVRQKKLQLEKEKLEMKLNNILCYQFKLLEAWGDIERQHLSAVTKTKECLHSVVCKVPLIEGAKMEPQSTIMTLGDALEVATSMRLILSNFPSEVDKMVARFAELAETVTQEKLLLGECLEIFKFVSTLEVEEMSLKCNLMQLKLRSEQHHHHRGHPEISA